MRVNQSVSWAAIRRLRRAAPLLAALAAPVATPIVTDTTTQSLSAQLYSAAEVSVPSSVTLSTTGSTFNNYTGTLLVSYKARTTSSGSATLTLSAPSEFSPSGGPTISGGSLSYTCGSAGLGTGCSGTQTVSSGSTGVVTVGASACTGGGGSCSSSDPATVQLSFTLANSPSYKTGGYTCSLVFTFSSV